MLSKKHLGFNALVNPPLRIVLVNMSKRRLIFHKGLFINYFIQMNSMNAVIEEINLLQFTISNNIFWKGKAEHFRFSVVKRKSVFSR